jgi:hypothetical protein
MPYKLPLICVSAVLKRSTSTVMLSMQLPRTSATPTTYANQSEGSVINMNIPQAVALKKKAVGIIYYGDILSVSFPIIGAMHSPRTTLIIMTFA